MGYWVGLREMKRTPPEPAAEFTATGQPSDGDALLSVVLASDQ
jgi:hypothetical protein